MTNAPFILICHPHHAPGFATPFRNEQDLVDRWIGGFFDARCNCCGGDSSVANYEAAIEDIDHDMHHVTRLDSRSEFDEYMAKNCHNKSPDSVYDAAMSLGWVDDDNDEEEQ